MIIKRDVNNHHQKNILLLEKRSEGAHSYANRIRQRGFCVTTAHAGLNVFEMIRSKLTKIDLIVINTNLALKELGGDQLLDMLMHYTAPVLILSDDNHFVHEMNIDRESSFKIIDHAPDGTALDNTIQKVLDVYRGETPESKPNGVSITFQPPDNSESRQFFESSGEAIVFFDASTRRILDLNPSMEKLTGMSKNHLIGKKIGQTAFFDSMDISDNLLDDIVARERAENKNCKAVKADGKQVFVTIKGQTYMSGGKPMVRCTLRQTAEKKSSEQNLRKELKKKEVMLQELQHRTKNTFAIITGLVELKSMSSESEESKQMLKELAMRVQSISDIYQLLYEKESSSDVNMATYCTVITKSIVGMSRDIFITKKTDDIYIGIKKATSLGLILVELLYNIMKYAFPDDSMDKKVNVELTKKGYGLRLKIADNGIGLSSDFKVGGSGSSGLSLVYLLAEQLNGSVHISSKKGTTVTVDIQYAG